MIQAHSKLREMFQKHFTIMELFRYPTVSDLAAYINQGQAEQPTFEETHNRAKRQRDAINKQRRLMEQRKNANE